MARRFIADPLNLLEPVVFHRSHPLFLFADVLVLELGHRPVNLVQVVVKYQFSEVFFGNAQLILILEQLLKINFPNEIAVTGLKPSVLVDKPTGDFKSLFKEADCLARLHGQRIVELFRLGCLLLLLEDALLQLLLYYSRNLVLNLVANRDQPFHQKEYLAYTTKIKDPSFSLPTLSFLLSTILPGGMNHGSSMCMTLT